MKRTSSFKILLLSLTAAMAGACNQGATDTEIDNENDTQVTEERQGGDESMRKSDNELRDFAREATSDGKMEVRLGEMAMERAQNQQVKRLAETIRSDHETANEELKEVARTNGWTLPGEMMEKHREKVDKLQDVSDEEFDQEYLKTMVKGHEEVVRKFEEVSQKLDKKEQSSNERAAGNTETGDVTGGTRDNTQNQSATGNRTGQNQNQGTNNNLSTNTGTDGGDARNQGNTPNTGMAAREPDHRQLKNWVDRTLPKLRQHLERSKELRDQVGQ